MDKRLVTLLLMIFLLPATAVCLAQSSDQEAAWLPSSWVWGSGYAPYYYPGGAWGYGYGPFTYYSLPGKTFNPYGDIFTYYSRPGKTFNPYGDIFTYYSRPGKTYNPYPYFYWYPENYWYP
jgi:hypothetical protein